MIAWRFFSIILELRVFVMNFKIVYLLLAVILAGFLQSRPSPANADQDNDDQTADIEFAENKELPVITFDITGGFRGRAPAGNNKPRLQIWPSGKVVCGSSSAEIKDVQSQLDAKELNDLLDFIVNGQKFYELTDEGIKKSIADAGEKIYIADAPTSNFVVNLKRGEHKLSVYGVKFVQKQMPKLKMMKRVSAIEDRLQRVIASAKIGGEDNARSIVKFINKRLKMEYPNAKAMTIDDLRTAQQSADGSITASFENELPDEEDNSTSRLVARYSRDENGQEEVKSYVFKNRK